MDKDISVHEKNTFSIEEIIINKIDNLLREIRNDINRLENRIDTLESRIDNRFNIMEQKFDIMEIMYRNTMILSQSPDLSSNINYTYVHPYNSFRTTKRKKRVLAL